MSAGLLRIADRRDAERAAEATTTVPSVGLDRRPVDGPATTAPATTVPSAGPDGGPTRTAPTAPTATTGGPPDDEGPPVVLRGDGVGAFRFGADPDEVLAGLTLRWGPPDADTGWVAAASSAYGVCPGTVVRGVDWRGFTVLFSDGATPMGGAGRRHFFTWIYRVGDPTRPAPDPGGNRPPLRTTAGVSVGVDVKTLQGAYGDRLELFDEPPGGPQFGVQTSEGGLFGSLTDLSASGIVRSIVGGGGCGE